MSNVFSYFVIFHNSIPFIFFLFVRLDDFLVFCYLSFVLPLYIVYIFIFFLCLFLISSFPVPLMFPSVSPAVTSRPSPGSSFLPVKVPRCTCVTPGGKFFYCACPGSFLTLYNLYISSQASRTLATGA